MAHSTMKGGHQHCWDGEHVRQAAHAWDPRGQGHSEDPRALRHRRAREFGPAGDSTDPEREPPAVTDADWVSREQEREALIVGQRLSPPQAPLPL